MLVCKYYYLPDGTQGSGVDGRLRGNEGGDWASPGDLGSPPGCRGNSFSISIRRLVSFQNTPTWKMCLKFLSAWLWTLQAGNIKLNPWTTDWWCGLSLHRPAQVSYPAECNIPLQKVLGLPHTIHDVRLFFLRASKRWGKTTKHRVNRTPFFGSF